MNNEEIILAPDPARIMEGLRDTGYDFNTAIADLIDNSIAANAKKISVQVRLDPNNEPLVYIADDGCGMDFEGLKNAMKYGSKERPNPSSLGKFGLGLKTASTAFCRSLSVLSKTNSSEYNKVCWDLDHVVSVNKWELLKEEPSDEEIDLLESISNGKSGTLVIWKKVDRLFKTYSSTTSLKKAHQRTVDNLSHHIAMVYQRFLDSSFTKNPVSIRLNDVEIYAWDPFCKKEINREVLAEKNNKVKLPDDSEKSFHLSAVLLPRKEDWSSPDAYKEARINNDNEGFYIYRENRLIYYGDWLGIFTNDPHISLLRVEFSFDHSLDELFNVDIKKSRIILNEDIWEYLKNSFLPAPRQRANDLYRSTVRKKVTEDLKDTHKKSNVTINDNANVLVNSKIEVIDKTTDTVKITNTNGSMVGKLKIIDTDDQTKLRVIPEEKYDDTFVWEGALANQEHAVIINTKHPFYTKVYSKIDNTDVITGLDCLLWALAEAELSTINDEVKQQYEDMRYQVSKSLKKLCETLPDPKLGDNDESN